MHLAIIIKKENIMNSGILCTLIEIGGASREDDV